jgi:glycosyltransferase involved in cell wall biosynthesis
MRILTFSTLFPNREMPRHGIFVAERLKHLLASGRIEAAVMAPVPWFPFESERFGAYSTFARVPREEEFEECAVLHPRYPVIPKIGMSLAPVLLAKASYRALQRLPDNIKRFDVIDAHYCYPDGVAASLLGKWLNKPVIITSRGTDLNLIPKFRLPRRQIQWAIEQATALVTVSDALRQRLLDLGARPEKISVLRNGVDLEIFRPLDRPSLKKELGMRGRTLLSVGNLVELKGHDIAIDALREMPETELVIVGAGPFREQLESRARRRRVSDRVRFTGTLSRTELVRYYNAADCLVLCSSREGMPNVILESLACGTPVVATAVGGIPEVVTDQAPGVLMEERSPAYLVAAIDKLFAHYPEARATRAYAEQFGWAPTVNGLLTLLERAK